mgnify:CR=1 FL=1
MKVNKGWVLRLAVAGFVLSGWRAAAAESSQAVVGLLLGIGRAERAVRAGTQRNHSVHPVKHGSAAGTGPYCLNI